MSTLESLDLKNLHVIVMQEFQTDEPRELSTDFSEIYQTLLGN